MRVEGPRGPRPMQGKRKASSSGSSFSLGDTTPTSAAQANVPSEQASAVGSIDAILALQSVGDQDGEKRRQTVDHGHDMLDQLDGLRIDLLAGRVSPERLSRLSVLLNKRPTSGDDELDALCDDIALRVAVELAKLDE